MAKPYGIEKLNAILAEHSTNGNVRLGTIDLYVRHGSTYIDGVMESSVFQLANIAARTPGTGAFTSLLPQLEVAAKQAGVDLIFVENVLNKRFRKFWETQGYHRVNRNLESCNHLLKASPDDPPIMSFAKRLNITS